MKCERKILYKWLFKRQPVKSVYGDYLRNEKKKNTKYENKEAFCERVRSY